MMAAASEEREARGSAAVVSHGGRAAFIWEREETLRERLWRAPLLPLAGLYRAGAWLDRKRHELGLRERVRLPLQVVSVGNLTVGGSGKTPTTAWLARALAAAGHRVAVLSRGMGGASGREVNIVSDGQRVLLGAAEVGDEPVWLARELPGIVVLAGANRAALGFRAAAAFDCDVALLDDGFQHHRLERDLDLVCVDAELGLGNRHVLPRGPLREPPGVLRRAHAIVFTRCDERPGEPSASRPRAVADLVGTPGQGLPQFRLGIRPTRLVALGGRDARPAERLAGARVGMLTAIARPASFRAVLDGLGAVVVEERIYPDHHGYSRADLATLSRSHIWMTTAKDAVKLPAAWLDGLAVEVLEEGVEELGPASLSQFATARLDAARSAQTRLVSRS